MKKLFAFLLTLLLSAVAAFPAYATDGTQAAADDTLLKIIVCLVIGLAVGLTVTLLMKRSMSTVRKQKRADVYVEKDSFSLTESRDIFLYSTVTRVRVNNSNNRK
ncbi:MAG: hypothetical protein E7609_02755 [Ruminococcaceae bacterium]|nr:hypothetical protein [Oscillospiraceae bacterium]